jgi:hypothetical protein
MSQELKSTSYNSKAGQGSRPPGCNLWPVAIIGFFTVAILGCAAFIAFCQMNPTDLVARDYYEQEIRYQAEMEKLARAHQLPEGVSAVFNTSSQRISVTLPQEHAAAGAAGVVQLYRPSAADLDRSYPLRLEPDGTQEIHTGALRPGLWRVRIRWTFQGQEFFAERKLEVPV